MEYKEALEWLQDRRSMGNVILRNDDDSSWRVHLAQADAAMMQQAYWVVKAHDEGLVRNAADELDLKLRELGDALAAEVLRGDSRRAKSIASDYEVHCQGGE